MHQTLYRKYRPLDLDDLCGQEVIATILKNQFKTNTTAHAYLFSGPRGTGKTSVAKIFARAINCEDENIKPCKKCSFCEKRQEETLDIIEIDAASNNGVEEIRELKSKINLTPTSGKYKVYIIDEVHMLTTPAFNALLKTLEEPPSYAVFILATTEPHKVPETILSRCQRFDFKRISEDAIVKRLNHIKEKEEIKIEEPALKEIARVAQGGLRDAIGLLEQAHAYSPTLITVDEVHKVNSSISQQEMGMLFVDIIEKRMANILDKVDNYYKEGKNMAKILEEIINFLRTNLVIRKTGLSESDQTHNLIAENINYEVLMKKQRNLNKFLLEMRYDNNPKTLLEIALIDLADNICDENNEEKIVEKAKKEPKEVKNEEKIVKNEVKEAKKEPKPIKKPKEEVNQEEDDGKKLSLLKRIRIDNTFAKVSKQFKNELIKMINNKASDITQGDANGHLLTDGEIKAASDEYQYFIIAFDSKTCVELYNKNLQQLEKLLEKTIKMKLKTIAITGEEWEEYREEFKEKRREYVYKKENGEADEYFKMLDQPQNIIEKSFTGLIRKK